MARGWGSDAGIALAVFGLTVGLLAADGFGDPVGPVQHLDPLGVLLAAVASLPLAACRRWPGTAYVVTSAGALTLVAAGYPLDVPFGPLVAVYRLAIAHGSAGNGGNAKRVRHTAHIGAVAAFTPTLTVVYAVGGQSIPRILPELAGLALMLLGAWFAGDRTRLRREQLAALREHAERVERETERERRLAAAEERTRIARELHDSAGHAINVILVQAGAARLLRERDPDRALRAIGTIEQVATDTIGEIDRLVRALRSGDQHAADPVPADPAAFEELVARHRAGGLTIATRIDGSRTELPTSVAWAAYRILQEALTNAARHGHGDAEVSVRLGPEAAEITVLNRVEPVQSGTAPGGHGIVGMRERATLLGGTLQAVADDGVFRLHAVLPYREATS